MKLSTIFILVLLVQSLQLQGQKAIRANIFRVDPIKMGLERNSPEVGRSLFYTLDAKQLRTLGSRNGELELAIPTFEKEKKLILSKVNILSNNFKVTDENKNTLLDGSDYEFYHGYIEGERESSLAGITIRGEEVNVLISDESGDFQINRFSSKHYVGFYSNELEKQKEFICESANLPDIPYKEKTSNRRSPSNGCVDIYFEADYSAYNKNGKSIINTTDWVVNLFNQVALQFNRVGVPIRISELLIHTTTDPYVSFATSSDVLYEFRKNKNTDGFNGRLAHFLSGRGLGGGVAFLNSLCSTYSNYAVSGNLSGSVVAYPNYSWNVMVISHELGHNFGSPHTQACRWNGDNTAIDGCADSEGSCPRPPAPTGGGTIMSYCHLNGVGINLTKGFGPQPGDLIFSRYSNANCFLSEDCSEVPPVNDICNAATELFPSISCIPWSYNNINATPSAGMGSFSCGTSADTIDVWFRLTIPATGRVNIETNTINGGLDDLIIETYTGNCFGLSLWACDDNSGIGSHAFLSIDDIAMAGEEIFIRVADSGSDNFGEFAICAYTEDVPCNYTLADSLVSFYNSTNGGSWTNKSGWEDGALNTDCDYCQWYGITCNNKAEIINIDLEGNNLSGHIIPSVDTFLDLVNLNLSNNSITGDIPVEIGKLSKLKTLKLDNNNFSDTLPNELFNLRELIYIDISNNQLIGTTPLYFGFHSNIDHIDFSNNNLSGCFENTLTYLCDITYFSMIGNPLLPFGGDLTLLCADGTGIDNDNDSHCANMTDCDDYEPASFDGNPEICDAVDNDCNGIVDDGFHNIVNEFLNIDTAWENVNNWSLGHTPLPCEEVIIGMNGENFEVSIPKDSYDNRMNGIKIGAQSILNIRSGAYVEILSKGAIENHGTMNIVGNIYCDKSDFSIPYGLRNYGDIFIDEGSIGFGDQSGDVIINETTGYILNKGYISIYVFRENISVINGIINYGTIDNRAGIGLQGMFLGSPLILKTNSMFITKGTEQWDEIYISNQ